MQLKERSHDRVPKYVHSAKIDFELLAIKQREYEEIFFNHRIWPENKFHVEKKRIEEEWKTRSPNNIGQSLALDIERLTIAYKQTDTNRILQVTIINSLFGVLYDYFASLYTDFDIGYISNEGYKIYLLQYQDAIDTNKRLNLDCWDKPAFKQIQSQIATILK